MKGKLIMNLPDDVNSRLEALKEETKIPKSCYVKLALVEYFRRLDK